jgi:sterol desaturase/sphingolipid hydroxylase (fatty acid hydroxylase superfamily)
MQSALTFTISKKRLFMDALLEYFNSLESKPLHRLAFLVLPILVLWFVENGFPLIRLRYKSGKMAHALVNFAFTLCHLVIHGLLAVFLVKVSDWCVAQKFGVVQWLQLPVWGIVVAGVLSMDFFGGWLVHWVEHKIPLLWRIHIVHHADTKVDVTTGLRHHPLEALNRWLFFTAGVLVMGLPVYAIMIGQTFMSMFTMLTHANIKLPARLDKALSYLFVSPNMHKVHHHWKQPFTDSNFGTAFSIWDRLLGSYRELDPAEIKYGLDKYYDTNRDEEIGALMQSPFYKHTS